MYPAPKTVGTLPQQHAFLNFLIERARLKNDAALGRFLKLAPPIISKLRHGRIPVTPHILLRAHEATDIPVAELRKHITH